MPYCTNGKPNAEDRVNLRMVAARAAVDAAMTLRCVTSPAELTADDKELVVEVKIARPVEPQYHRGIRRYEHVVGESIQVGQAIDELVLEGLFHVA